MCDKMQRIVDEEVREAMKQAEKEKVEAMKKAEKEKAEAMKQAEEEKADAIYKLTATTDWTDEHIADVFGTTAEYVAKIRMGIDKK